MRSNIAINVIGNIRDCPDELKPWPPMTNNTSGPITTPTNIIRNARWEDGPVIVALNLRNVLLMDFNMIDTLLVGKLWISGSLENPRGADEASELRSVLIHTRPYKSCCQPGTSPK
jgi:hypothetical protein